MKTTENQLILDFMAIDPGRSKCGMARFVAGLPVEQGVVSPEELVSRLTRKPEKLLVVGGPDGSGSPFNATFPRWPACRHPSALGGRKPLQPRGAASLPGGKTHRLAAFLAAGLAISGKALR